MYLSTKHCIIIIVVILVWAYMSYHTMCYNKQLLDIVKMNNLQHLINKKDGSGKIKDKVVDITKKGISEFAKSQKLEEIPKFID
jgi:hypothetical protein